VDFGVLGPVEVWRAGEVLPVGSGRERFVLAMLLLNADRVVAADRLVDAMWEVPPSSARAQLHNMISNLRRRLDVEGLIATRPVGYELLLGCHQLDLARFRRLVERGRELAAAGEHGPAAATLSEAAALWRGPALADVPDALVGGLREALHDERLAAAEAQLDAELTLGRYDAVLQALAALLFEHPYRERLYEVQLVALVGSGRRADALAAYQRVYRRFVEDLGVEPGYALRRLEQRILRGEALGPDRPHARATVPRELPPVVPVLTGRDKLIGAVSDALRRMGDSGPVIAVLVGPGGVGKTAVAVACAHALAEAFPDGQLHADLRGSHERPADSHAVVGRFLRTLGVDGASLPDDREERVAMYRSRLADRRTLVVLDDAASEDQVRLLVPGGSHCAALVTSRRQLGALVGAKRWRVPLLAAADAVELFVRIVGPDRVATVPEAAIEIVKSCGRLPLAVCIAAARLAARPDWTVDELRRRLAEERDRLDELSIGDLDVRVSIGLSYRTLDPLPRTLFHRLGRAGFPDWPDWVADTLLDQPAGRLLDQLTDAHLIEPVGRDAVGQSRFRLHDLVATFARERSLAEDQHWTEAQSRLLSAWLSLATVADKQIPHDLVRAPATDTASPPAAAARLARDTPSGWFEAERRCLLLAVDQACHLDPPDLAGALALRVAGFLSLRGYHDDWDRTVRQALSRVVEPEAGRLRARLLGSLCIACNRRDRYAELSATAEEELAVARRLNDREEEVRALTNIGLAAIRTGRYNEAIDRLEQALNGARRPDVPDRLLLDSLRYLAFANMTTGRADHALPLIEEALRIGRASSHTSRTALHLYHYGMVLAESGRPEESAAPLAEALRIFRELGNDMHAAYVEQTLADIDIRFGRHTVAAERLGRARQAHEKIGEGDGLAEAIRSTGDLAAAQGDWPTAINHLCRALAIWRTIESHVEVARTLARLERARTTLDQRDAAETCRREYRSILARLRLDEACLYLPVHYISGR
jgi:DNA-binding SARP family transcriptional activator